MLWTEGVLASIVSRLESWTRVRFRSGATNESGTRRPPSKTVEEVRSSSTSVSTRDDEDSTLHQTKGQQNGGEGLTGSLADDVSSDSDSDPDLDSEEEEFFNLGDGLWVHEKYLDYLAKPKDIDILLYHRRQPDNHYWLAVAPEWDSAQGFGSSREEASEDLQSKLSESMLALIEDKDVEYIKTIPIEPCWKNADKARRRWASYYDDLQKNSSEWEWGKISM